MRGPSQVVVVDVKALPPAAMETFLETQRKLQYRGVNQGDRDTLERLRASLEVGWDQECRLATINENGLRDLHTRDLLVLFIMDFSVKICALTEMPQGEMGEFSLKVVEQTLEPSEGQIFTQVLNNPACTAGNLW